MMINIKDVSLRKDGAEILKNINWGVKENENWAILGLNGSGKTSLLNIINGYTFPSKGEVSVLGKKFGKYDLRELRKSIGWVSSSLQESLYLNESVEEIVLSGKFASIGLYDYTTEEDNDKALALLARFGCAGLRGRIYATLSQGEKQKIILARALMSSPKILILDEPCSGLDIFARENFLAFVQQFENTAETPSLLYVTHHIEEILPVFKNILLMKDGMIFSSGIKEEVLTSKNLFEFFERKVEVEWKNERPLLHFIMDLRLNKK